MKMDRDYYAILGVLPEANIETLKKAYWKRALECHPDRGGSHEQMTLINEAWAILSDPVTRRHYDSARRDLSDDVAQRTAEVDVQNVRPEAEEYPRKWADFDDWFGSHYNVAYYPFGMSFPTGGRSITRWLFIIAGFMLGLCTAANILVSLGIHSGLGYLIMVISTAGGAWLAVWFHYLIMMRNEFEDGRGYFLYIVMAFIVIIIAFNMYMYMDIDKKEYSKQINLFKPRVQNQRVSEEPHSYIKIVRQPDLPIEEQARSMPVRKVPEVPMEELYVQPQRLNMRKGPGTEHEVMTVLTCGEAVLAQDEILGWRRIMDSSSKSKTLGWIRGSFLGSSPLIDQGAGSPASVRSDTTFFTIGSSREVVLSLQGRPTQTTGTSGGFPEIWYYEFSSVTFSYGKVKEYANLSNNLEVRVNPLKDLISSFWTIGSDRDTVLAAQGTPTQITNTSGGGREVLYYEDSTIIFSEGKVQDYHNFSMNLKVK